MKNAIALCSGGLDSVVTSHYIKNKLGYNNLILLFFDYGQRTRKQEKKAAKYCAEKLRAKFREIKIRELSKISAALINNNKKANKIERNQLKDTKKEAENWYVPCRNSIFLIYALAIAESKFVKKKEVWDIFTGFKNEGQEAYPDTTPEFIKEINKLSQISAMTPSKIIAPLIKKDKEDIIRLGEKIGVEFDKTYTCYVGAWRKHCGYCLSCRLRQEGFYWAGIKDPTKYKIKMKDFR